MNIDVNEQRPVQVPAFISFGYIPEVLYGDYTILYSH